MALFDRLKKKTVKFNKRFMVIFLLYLCVLLCGCHGNIIANLKTSEHTELLVDGEYKPFNVDWEYAPKKPSGIYIVYRMDDLPQGAIGGPYTMKRLIELAQAGDTDGLCECFSLAAKGTSEDMPEKAQRLAEFLCERMASWEFYTWTENIEMIDGAKATTQEMFFYLHTDNGLYRCDIREVLEGKDPADVGVSVFPALYPGEDPEYEDKVYKEYCTWGRDNAGISIVYQQEN